MVIKRPRKNLDSRNMNSVYVMNGSKNRSENVRTHVKRNVWSVYVAAMIMPMWRSGSLTLGRSSILTRIVILMLHRTSWRRIPANRAELAITRMRKSRHILQVLVRIVQEE